VNKDCTVCFEGSSYVVPHTLVGHDLVLRVKDRVQDKRFYEALKEDREMNRRKYGRGKSGKGRARCTISPLKPLYDLDVEVRSPHVYDYLTGEVRP